MTMLKLIAATVSAGAVLAAFSTTVYATNTVEQEQKLDQKIELVCEVGAYGQTTKCEAKGEQSAEQKQKVTFKNGRVLGKTHKPVDTALDLPTTIASLATIGTGAGAFVLNRKLQ